MSRKFRNLMLILLFILTFSLIAKSSEYEPLITIGKPALRDILYSPDGRFLATLTNPFMELLDAETFAPISRVSVDGGKLSFSKDGSLLAIFGRKSGIHIWSMNSETFLETIPIKANTVEFSPDGRYLAYADGDSVFLWDIEQRKTVIELTGDPQPTSRPGFGQQVKAFTFHPNRNIIAIASFRRTVSLWDIQTQKIVSYLELEKGRYPHTISFSHDGNLLAAIAYRNNFQESTIQLWGISTGDTQNAIGKFSDIIFTPDNQRLLVGGQDGNLHIIQVDTFDIESKAAIERLPPDNIGQAGLKRLTLHPDGKSFACLINGSRIGVWDAQSFSRIQTIYGYHVAREYTDAVYLPEVNRIVTCGRFSNSDVLLFWDATTGEILRASEYFMPTECLVAAPDGRRIAMAWNCANEIWDASTAKQLHVLPRGGKFGGPSREIAFSASGRYLASNGWRGTFVWNAKTGEEINWIRNDWSDFPLLLFTSDEQQVLIISDEKEMTEFWDIETGELTKKVGRIGPMVNVGNDFVQARQQDDSIEIYMFRSGKRLCQIPDIPETTNSDMFWQNRFHPSGNVLAVHYEKEDEELQEYRFYNSHTGKLLSTIPGIRHIQFTADGDYMFMFNDEDQLGLYLTSDVLGKSVPHVFTVHAFDKITTFGQIKRGQLLQNYPNPFNPETWIPYQLQDDSEVTISIYNSTGKLMRSLFLGNKNAGTYASRSEAAFWDGKNSHGEDVANGSYFCIFQAGEFTDVRKMAVIR